MKNKPSDFEIFWNEKIKKLKPKHLNIKLIKSGNLNYYDLNFESFDKTIIYGNIIRPSNPNGLSVIAYHGFKGIYRRGFFDELLQIGYTIYTYEMRDQNGRTVDLGNHKPVMSRDILDKNNYYILKTFLDSYLFYISVFAKFPDETFNLYGYSQGGAHAIVIGSLLKTNKIVAVAPSFFNHPERINKRLGSGGEIAAYLDENPKNIKQVFSNLRYFETGYFLKNLKANSLIIYGSIDNICPFELYYPYSKDNPFIKTFIVHDKNHGTVLENSFDYINKFFKNQELTNIS